MRDHDSLVSNAFLDAPLADEGWTTVLHRLADETGAARAQIVAFANDNSAPFNVMTHVDTDWYREFEAIDGANPAVNWRLRLAGRPLEIIDERHYDIARVTCAGDIYDDFAVRHDMLDGCQTVLSSDHDSFIGLATMRARSDGRTSDRQRERFGSLAPFALAGIRLQIALENQGAALLANALESVDAAAFIIDRRGNVLALTSQAEAVLSAGTLLRLHDRRLHPCRPDEARSFARALEVLCQHGHERPPPSVWLGGADDLPAGRRCEFHRLPVREWAFAFRPHGVVILRRAATPQRHNEDLLRTALGLTRAEAVVAAALARGLSREEIALTRGASLHTVNTQMKTIFSKAGVQREAALVALVLALTAG